MKNNRLTIEKKIKNAFYIQIIFVIITFYKVEINVNKERALLYLLRNECGYSVFFLLSSIVLFDMQNSDLGKKICKKK